MPHTLLAAASVTTFNFKGRSVRWGHWKSLVEFHMSWPTRLMDGRADLHFCFSSFPPNLLPSLSCPPFLPFFPSSLPLLPSSFLLYREGWLKKNYMSVMLFVVEALKPPPVSAEARSALGLVTLLSSHSMSGVSAGAGQLSSQQPG